MNGPGTGAPAPAALVVGLSGDESARPAGEVLGRLVLEASARRVSSPPSSPPTTTTWEELPAGDLLSRFGD